MDLICLVVLLLSAFVFENATALPKGNSAWLYGKNQEWVLQIKNYNTHSPAGQINYLFPETGVIHIDSNDQSLLMTYDPDVTKFYKQNLKNVKILPDLSFWVANTNFKTWPVKKYQKAADQIAKKIMMIPMQMVFFWIWNRIGHLCLERSFKPIFPLIFLNQNGKYLVLTRHPDDRTNSLTCSG